MKFRPCIDIHDGKVKQIVGGSLLEEGKTSNVEENFVSEADAGYFASLYKKMNLLGGHIILLNKPGTEEYEADMKQASYALKEFRGGMQIGGGITCENAERMLEMGASHVIVTSFVFKDGKINFDNLVRLSELVGREHLVLDLSCRKKASDYYVVTDRWQKFTDVKFTKELVLELDKYCDEFLVHAVDVEGRASGIESGVAKTLGECEGIISTYAGGIASFSDLDMLNELGNGKVDFTVGSALDIFGGNMSFDKICYDYSIKNMK